MNADEVSHGSARVGVIGLGIMGGAFARHLVAAGLRTAGYDLAPENVREFALLAGRGCANAREVADASDIVITSLPSAAALEDALFGNAGVTASARPGLLVIETSTLSVQDKAEARVRLSNVRIDMLDAPISGTGPQASNKDIAIFASGDRAVFDKVSDILSFLARSVRYVGPFGSGSKLKFIANLLVAIHIAAAAEAIVLGEKAGFDASLLVEILADSAATSRMLEIRGPVMATGAFDTPMMKADVFQKDLALIAAFARESGCPAPLFSATGPLFAELSAQGMGQQDTAAVVSILRQLASHV